ncbi:lamin tail domain-containing protein [Chitinophagales bacterium]|nr:lamin tail domain-containing protein [Chitinophagales bacterium]
MFLVSSVLSGQVFMDDFEAAQLSEVWLGNTELFQTGGGELIINHPDAESSNISTLSALAITSGETQWDIYVRLELNPSSGNFARWYLQSDNPDLSGSLNGYYVQVGGVSGTVDDVSLYRQTGNGREVIIDGLDGAAGEMPAFRLRVTRDASGNWELLREEGGSYLSEGTVFDDTYPTGTYAGVYARYTSTTSSDYFFDDFLIDPVVIDTDPPELLGITVTGYTDICLSFTEAINPATQAVENFVINGFGSPNFVYQSPDGPEVICLHFPQQLVADQDYVLNLSGLADNAGNEILPINSPFSFQVPSPGDLIINELLLDEAPVVGLPAAEYVEIFNRTSEAIDLGGWLWSDDSDSTTLSSYILQPGAYVLLVDEDDLALFSDYSEVLPVADWPSLNNDDNAVQLVDPFGGLIDRVSYAASWYQDTEKAMGGYSLERIDGDNLCDSGANWIASVNVIGGTPAAENSVNGLFVDDSAPFLLSLSLIEEQFLQLSFSEAIDPDFLFDASNYTVNQSIGNPSALSFEDGILSLEFATSFELGNLYTLSVSDLTDCSGNIMVPSNSEFAIPQEVSVFDVLINEIYADTTTPEEFENPQADLPNSEFIELFNRSNKTLSLAGWVLQDAIDTTYLDDYLLLPGRYVVLCPEARFVQFVQRGIPALAVSSFPTLNDGDDDLSISDPSFNLIHAISYDQDIFVSEYKAEGGWTYELIDPTNPCGGMENLAEAIAFQGGTPGLINSVNESNPDTVIPQIERAEAIDPFTIQLFFSEWVDSEVVLDIANYSFNGGPIESIDWLDIDRVVINLDQAIEEGVFYQLTVNGIVDCVGNVQGNAVNLSTGLPSEFVAGDVVLNELVFNPVTGSADFLELYNTSEKIIDLSDWFVANDPDPDDGIDEIANLSAISIQQYSLFPGEYIVLTEDAESVGVAYSDCHDQVGVDYLFVNLPTYGANEGTVAITDLTASIFLDKLIYEDDWHFALLDEDKGVSLERINPLRPTQDRNNWQSASQTSCFGTPGYLNSQFYPEQEVVDNFAIDPPAFSPDGDSFKDVAFLSYAFDEPGFTVNVRIFDDRGRSIIRLINNEIVGASGTWKWTGIDEQGELAPIGIYIIYFEAFSLDGTIIRKNLPIALGKMLN